MRFVQAWLIFLVLAPVSALWADTQTLIHCAHPSSRFHIYQSASEIVLEIHSPYGTKFTPFYEGNVTATSLAALVGLESRVRALPQVITLKWPSENCHLKESLIECENGLGTLGVKARIYSELRDVKTLSYQFTKYLLHVSFLESTGEGPKRLGLIGDFTSQDCITLPTNY